LLKFGEVIKPSEEVKFGLPDKEQFVGVCMKYEIPNDESLLVIYD
jgi:hypothetical protein